MKAIAIVLLLLSATAASGQYVEVTIECEAGSTPVSLLSLPDGGGQRLDEAGATLYVWLVDVVYGPIEGYPAEDIWLEFECSGTFAGCMACNPDQPTDADGMTFFAEALEAGGWSYAEGESCLVIYINGMPFTEDEIFIYPNSADVTGDGIVNLADISIFTGTLFGEYDFSCDFLWDGVINLSDAVLMAEGNGTACP